MDRSPPDSFVHGILQARILEQVAISFSRGSHKMENTSGVGSDIKWRNMHRTALVTQCLGLCAPKAGGWLLSLVRELALTCDESPQATVKSLHAATKTQLSQINTQTSE